MVSGGLQECYLGVLPGEACWCTSATRTQFLQLLNGQSCSPQRPFPCVVLSIPSLMKAVACAAAVSEEADDELQQLLQSFSTGVDSADACEEPSQVGAVLCVANQSQTTNISVTIALCWYVVSSTFVPGTDNVYEHTISSFV